MKSVIGKGWLFPLKPLATGALVYEGGAQKIRQSIWIILSTAPGERVMLPQFGCGIHELVFDANTITLRALVQEKVREALVQWEPRIDVLDVRVETPPEQGNHLLIYIDYRERSSNTFYNMVYPFFINEGIS